MNYGKLHQVMPKMVMVLSDNNVGLSSILSELSTVKLSLMGFGG
jgi:hypothetical protein